MGSRKHKTRNATRKTIKSLYLDKNIRNWDKTLQYLPIVHNLTQNQIPSTLLIHDGKKSNWKSTQVDFQALLYLKGSINLICKRKLSQITIAINHWNKIRCKHLLVFYFKLISGANKTHNVVYFALKSTHSVLHRTQPFFANTVGTTPPPPPLSHVAV